MSKKTLLTKCIEREVMSTWRIIFIWEIFDWRIGLWVSVVDYISRASKLVTNQAFKVCLSWSIPTSMLSAGGHTIWAGSRGIGCPTSWSA